MNIKSIINHTLVNEIMRLAKVWVEAQAALAVRMALSGITTTGPSPEEMAQASAYAKNELRDFCYGLAQIAPENDPTLPLLRRQEIIADIGFEMGARWGDIDVDVRCKIMEAHGGSRGLMQELNLWAVEFDAFWEALPEHDDRREDYITEIDNFACKKMNEMVANHGG